MKNEKKYTPRKNLYIADAAIWDKAERMAKKAKSNVSKLFCELIREAK